MMTGTKTLKSQDIDINVIPTNEDNEVLVLRVLLCNSGCLKIFQLYHHLL